ncbi:MAG: prepilin-type N-terminal cleavage/methylation domain-containing protein [Chitinophagaceae bacterium]|nr:prepilin-type N-terminal cleavage/methylation domain-containing protein [Polaromonas sp.]
MLAAEPLALHWNQSASRRRVSFRDRQCGFTLIELLVAISIMAVMAVMSWRGLDAMTRAQSQTSQRADAVLALQAGLSQWKVDLDAIAQGPRLTSLDWDGRAMRLTRRSTLGGDGLIVVAWTKRADQGGSWLRWQSPIVRTHGDWDSAWSRASAWAQNGGIDERSREVEVALVESWKIFYYREDSWTNPLSSDGMASAAPPPPRSLLNPPPLAPLVQGAVPEGIRLELMLPPGQALNGKLIVDWVRPTFGGSKS